MTLGWKGLPGTNTLAFRSVCKCFEYGHCITAAKILPFILIQLFHYLLIMWKNKLGCLCLFDSVVTNLPESGTL
jgi:hypothetical protein